jgi:hypothetical protein
MVPPVNKKNVVSMLTVQEAPRQRKGDYPTTMEGLKEKEHILRETIDDANTSNGMRQYNEMRYKVVCEKEHVHIGWDKWVLKVFDPGIGYRGNCFATRP